VVIKRDNQWQRAVLARIRDGLPDDLLMTKVHSVEKTNREADLAVAGVQFVGGSDELHET
jgi:hypothetical protein